MVNTFRIEMWLIAYLNLIHSPSKLILSHLKVYDSLYYFLIFYSIQGETNNVEEKDTKILAPERS